MDNNVMFSCIFARDISNGFGYQNTLPWHYTDDLKYFKRLTTNSVIILGYNTWISLPKRLPNRIHIVCSSKQNLSGPDHVCTSLDSALECAKQYNRFIFVIGGISLLREAFMHPLLITIYETLILETHICDTFFPDVIPDNFRLTSSSTSEQNVLMFNIYDKH